MKLFRLWKVTEMGKEFVHRFDQKKFHLGMQTSLPDIVPFSLEEKRVGLIQWLKGEW